MVLKGEYIGLPYSPPYLSFMRGFTKQGLNFASAGCGILPETGYEYVSSCLFLSIHACLPDQMNCLNLN